MAAKRPWYQRNGAAIVMGSMHMPSSDHKWAYSVIIDMLNDRDGPLPDDAGFICGLTGLSKRRWSQVREFLLNDVDPNGDSRLFINERGYITNPRFERELAQRRDDYEKSVEHGRKGGKKSAEKRANEQGDLGLGDDYLGEKSAKRARKDNFSPTFRDEISEIIYEKPPETGGFDQPPPQASRAGASARQRLEIEKEEESTRANESPRGPTIDRSDLKALMDACSIASGYFPTSPGHIDRAFSQIEAWRAAGIDFDQIVIPVIKRTVAMSDDPTSSFGRFDRKVRHEHARSAAAKGSAAAQATLPIARQDADDPRVVAIRAALKDSIGVSAYVNWIGPNVAAMHVNGIGLVIDTKSDFSTTYIEDNLSSKIRHIASQHSIDRVVIRTLKMPQTSHRKAQS